MTRPLVVDASALLVLLLQEAGAPLVAARLPGSSMSVVNLAEVVSQLIQRGLDAQALDPVIQRLQVELAPVDADQSIEAGQLHAATRSHGLALADCYCLVLARRRDAEVLTADRAWSKLKIGVPITLVR